LAVQRGVPAQAADDALQESDDDLGADPLQAVHAAEDADGGHRRVRIAQSEGAQRQTPAAAIDLAQRSRLEGNAGGGGDAVDFLQFVDGRVGHCSLFRRSVQTVIVVKTAATLARYRCRMNHSLEGKHAMKTFIDRLFGDIDRVFDESWVVIWQLDDF
jgi:hypothetical protein